MDTREYQIRAKKISELDVYNKDIETYGDNSYVIIGYNDDVNKQNYKMNLTQLAKLANGIDDETLARKINELIDNDEIQISDSYLNLINNLENEINELRNEMNRYHGSYSITYVLNNLTVTPAIYTIMPNESKTLYFTPDDGYKMPRAIDINVTGCLYDYSENNKSLNIYNADNNVIIEISAIKENYTISYDFIGIEYSYNDESEHKEVYEKNESIHLSLNAIDGFILPDSIEYENCICTYIVNNDKKHADLTIICNGQGNMYVNCTGIGTSTYYFGFVSDSIIGENSTNITVTYLKTDDDVINGIDTFELNSLNNLTSSTMCPYNINTSIDVGIIGYGGESFVIVPKKYVRIDSIEHQTFFKVDNSNTEYRLYSDDFQDAPQPIYINKLISINGVDHYAIWLGDSIQNNFKFIIK